MRKVKLALEGVEKNKYERRQTGLLTLFFPWHLLRECITPTYFLFFPPMNVASKRKSQLYLISYLSLSRDLMVIAYVR